MQDSQFLFFSQPSEKSINVKNFKPITESESVGSDKYWPVRSAVIADIFQHTDLLNIAVAHLSASVGPAWFLPKGLKWGPALIHPGKDKW